MILIQYIHYFFYDNTCDFNKNKARKLRALTYLRKYLGWKFSPLRYISRISHGIP